MSLDTRLTNKENQIEKKGKCIKLNINNLSSFIGQNRFFKTSIQTESREMEDERNSYEFSQLTLYVIRLNL